MRTIFILNNLFLIFSLLQSNGNLGAAKVDFSAPVGRPEQVEKAPSLTSMTISLKAATDATILYKAGNGKEVNAPQDDGRQIPYLVLNRNGVPTPNFERTLHIALDNLQVPTSGLYASLEIDTQHSDPDLSRGSTDKIRVWEEKRFIPYLQNSLASRSIEFTVLFQRIFEYQKKAIHTPTDYYSYQISILDSNGNLLRTIEQDYAFLLENQWRAPLPKVLEAAPGAAPQDLVVYFCDMIPFQSSFRDPETHIPRQDIERYIQTELIPAMVEAFEVQTNTWELPWYEEWTNFRTEENPKTLSVALDEYGTWFHGAAPSLGHAMISIRVDGSFGEYANITDGILSVFHHELFHNQQRNISLHFGAKGNISGQEGAWEIFSEGTAVLASQVGQPDVQMDFSPMPRSYLKRANAFIGSDGSFPGSLNTSYKEIPYNTALYWRYLYEQCGGINGGTEDPATGMQVIRHVLETLYSGNIADINASTSVIADFPQILDVALYQTPTCPFHDYEESLVHFTRAIYQLRLEDGRCKTIPPSSACGFFDPNNVYSSPGEESYSIVKDGRTSIDGSIRSSFGVDIVKISTDASLNGKSLKILFKGAPSPDYTYNIELWHHAENEAGAERPIVSRQSRSGATIITIDKLDVKEFPALDLVITRTDANENISQPGQYTIQVIVN